MIRGKNRRETTSDGGGLNMDGTAEGSPTGLGRISAPTWMALAISIGLHIFFWLAVTVEIPVGSSGRSFPAGVRFQPPIETLDPVTALRFETRLLLRDPTLLSLPSRRGFSRDVLDRWPATAYRRPVWGWKDASLPPPNPEGTKRRILPERTPGELAVARVRPPAPTPTPPALDDEAVPRWPEGILVRYGGELSGLERIAEPVFPPLPESAPAGPVLVRVGVDRRGVPRHLLLLSRSGDEAVDRAVLQGVRTVRFAASTGGRGLIWGRIAVFWPRKAAPGPEDANAAESGAPPAAPQGEGGP